MQFTIKEHKIFEIRIKKNRMSNKILYCIGASKIKTERWKNIKKTETNI